ncbi:hypothetical protein GQ457_12G019910 [Hibiscus cannabinus]
MPINRATLPHLLVSKGRSVLTPHRSFKRIKSVTKLDGPCARIANYFDVVAETSIGGLISGILTTPNDENRPKFAAKHINEFYYYWGPRIFAPKERPTSIKDFPLCHPVYNGMSLREAAHLYLRHITMSETVTNVVIQLSTSSCLNQTHDIHDDTRIFNLVDGGLAADNPVRTLETNLTEDAVHFDLATKENMDNLLISRIIC